MSGERPTLRGAGVVAVSALVREALASGDQTISEATFIDAMTDAARQWFLALLTDERVLERCAQADCSSWGTGGTWELIGSVLRSEHRDAARAVLAVIAEAVRDER